MPVTEQQIRQYVDAKLAGAGLTAEELNSFYALARGGYGRSDQPTGNYAVNLQNAMAKLGFKNSNEFLNFVKGASSLYGKISWEEAAGLLGLNPDGSDPNAEQPVDPDAAKAAGLAAELDDFAREMMRPVNLNDPYVRQIVNNVSATLSNRNANSGIGGGMADAAVAKGVGEAALNIQSQRQALGASVMGNRLVDQRQLNMYKDQAARMALDEDYQNKLAQWESQRGFGQQLGGVLGAIGGGIGGFFLGGGPTGALVGATAGYGFGSGLGGSMSGGPPAKSVYKSPYYGYSTGGMSGNKGGW